MMEVSTPNKLTFYLTGNEMVGLREGSGNVSIHEGDLSIRIPASNLPSLLEKLEQAYMEYDDYDEQAMGESKVAREVETTRAHFDLDKELAEQLDEYLVKTGDEMSVVINCAISEYINE